MPIKKENSSFRDDSGFLFYHQDILYRSVSIKYKVDYDRLMQSGLYNALTAKEWLVSHTEESATELKHNDTYKIIKPSLIPFISYPWEWSFHQLKDAALLTLDIHLEALKHDMVLKDASAFNVQFHGSTPIFIDTLSFESYREIARTNIIEAVKEIRQHNFSINPKRFSNTEHSCQYCPFRDVCFRKDEAYVDIKLAQEDAEDESATE